MQNVTESVKRWGGLGVKLAVVGAALWLVLSNADLTRLVDKIGNMGWGWFALACAALALSQSASAMRMRAYFAGEGLVMTRRFSVMLYAVSMFYNTVIPGSVGGDGYKVYLLRRRQGFPALKGVRIALSERASGLFVLGLSLLLLLAVASHFPPAPLGKAAALALLAVMLCGGYWAVTRYALREKPRVTLAATGWSAVVQGFSLLTVLCLLAGLGVHGLLPEYLALFQVAAVVGILPLSLNGLGLRELVFFYGAPMMATDAEAGVVCAFLYFAVYFCVALLGLPFLHKVTSYPITSEEEGHGGIGNPQSANRLEGGSLPPESYGR